ncbi:MAG: SIR2 family protein [Deltaproteobacteria bacterium]|nr:SIR2 family protein [Deltaproteobacteria bacterium]MDI6880868.1 SIR2 family protein [Desulfitobacteriaceae bacterium]
MHRLESLCHQGEQDAAGVDFQVKPGREAGFFLLNCSYGPANIAKILLLLINDKALDIVGIMSTRSVPDIYEHIRAKLNAPNVCFLFGAGSSKCVGYPLMSELTQIALDKAKSKPDVSGVMKKLSGCTIEEQLEELFGQLRSPGLSKLDEHVMRETVEHIYDVIFEECSKIAILNHHKKFVRSIYGRMGERKRFHIFTTNYDMLFEWACDHELIHCINGFLGVQCRIYDPNQFDIRPARIIQTRRSGASARLFPCFCLYKLHGSVSWITDGITIKEVQLTPGAKRQYGQLMVFPTPQKYSETYKTPYMDMFTRMRDILSTKQTVLITHGFGFADAHIKPMIEQCLNDNTFILIVISKDMLTSFESFKYNKNVSIITEDVTIIGGKEYSINNNIWDFSNFVNLI